MIDTPPYSLPQQDPSAIMAPNEKHSEMLSEGPGEDFLGEIAQMVQARQVEGCRRALQAQQLRDAFQKCLDLAKFPDGYPGED